MNLASKPSTGADSRDVERLALRDAFHDVEQDDVAEFLQAGEMGERAADLAGADQRDLLARHGWSSLRATGRAERADLDPGERENVRRRRFDAIPISLTLRRSQVADGMQRKCRFDSCSDGAPAVAAARKPPRITLLAAWHGSVPELAAVAFRRRS